MEENELRLPAAALHEQTDFEIDRVCELHLLFYVSFLKHLFLQLYR